MKILYFGTVRNFEEFEKIIKISRRKVSSAPQVFENMLMKGFADLDNIDIQVSTFPSISTYPGSPRLFWSSKKERINDRISTTLIPSINIPFIKQTLFSFFSKIVLRKWLKENIKTVNKAVIIYSIYEPIAKNIINLCEKYHCKCFAIVPDLPIDYYSKTEMKGLTKFFYNQYVKKGVSIQNKFSGYIYFTEQMKFEINPSAPYIVLEGIADNEIFNDYITTKKYNPKAIMYAGTLDKIYGINILIEAFMQIDGNYELWICGSGNFEKEIQNYAQKDNRIKYLGRVERNRVLKYEKQASLLVNVRDNKPEYTKFSFPSKTLEYMASGTPLLSSNLSGIPKEYFKYIYCIENITVENLKLTLSQIMAYTANSLEEKGKQAADFVLKNKSSKSQAALIENFIIGQLKHEKTLTD